MAPSPRSTQMRSASSRPTPSVGHQEVFPIKRSEIPDGMVYQGIRQSTFGEPDNSNVQQAIRAGWRAVPASRHPHLGPLSLDGKPTEGAEYIQAGGLILMERPKEMDDDQRAALREEAQAVVDSVDFDRVAKSNEYFQATREVRQQGRAIVDD